MPVAAGSEGASVCFREGEDSLVVASSSLEEGERGAPAEALRGKLDGERLSRYLPLQLRECGDVARRRRMGGGDDSDNENAEDRAC